MNRRRAAPLLLLCLAACGPGAPPQPCTVVAGSGQGARVFTVTHRVRLDDAENLATFAASFRRHTDAIAGCHSADRPNLILFPQDSGLVAWFSGRKALVARNLPDSKGAFTALYEQGASAADAYRRRFPGISDRRALVLALSDRTWRTMDRTFGGLARETNSWVVASARLPYSDQVDDAAFRDPDATGLAYVATTAEVFDSAFVWGPSGERVGRSDRVFLDDDDVSMHALSAAPLEQLAPIDLPFVRLGIASGRDAFVPATMQRLDDLGAELVVQPHAFRRWTQEESPGDWLPDVMLGAGWTATQKYTGLRHVAAPVLTGNLFERSSDGQAFITAKSLPETSALGFVASEPVGGFLAVGPWAFAEPDATAPLAERRTAARTLGADLLPDSHDGEEGNGNDSVIAADLRFDQNRAPPPTSTQPTLGREVAPAPNGHQRNPAIAFGAKGHFYAAWEDGRSGTPRIWITRSEDDGQTWAEAHAVDPEPGTSRQLRPSIAAGPDGLVVVAWQDDARGSEQIRWAVSRDSAFTFVPGWAERSARAQWEPAAAAIGADGWALTWADFREGTPHVRVRCFAINQPTAPSRGLDAAVGAQLQPALAGTARDALFAAWVDQRDGDWQVRARAGALCDADGSGLALSADGDSEVVAADPQVARAPDGRVLVVWDELRDRRGHRALAGSQLRNGVWLDVASPAVGPVSRFRPSPYWKGAFVTAVQDLAPGKNTLARWVPNGAEPDRFDDSGNAANQLTRPRGAARLDSAAAVVVYEDDRDGWVRVRSLQR